MQGPFAGKRVGKKQLRRSAGKRRIITNSAPLILFGPRLRAIACTGRRVGVKPQPVDKIFARPRFPRAFWIAPLCFGAARQSHRTGTRARLSPGFMSARIPIRFGLLLSAAFADCLACRFCLLFSAVLPCPAPVRLLTLLLPFLCRTPLRPGPLASKRCRSKSTRSCLTSGSSR